MIWKACLIKWMIFTVTSKVNLTYIDIVAPISACFGILLNEMYYQKIEKTYGLIVICLLNNIKMF